MKAVLALALVAGCRSGDRQAEPIPDEAVPGAGIRLVDPGGQPRQILRYRFATGAAPQKVRIAMLSTDTVQKGSGPSRTFPANELGFDLAVATTGAPNVNPSVTVALDAVTSTDRKWAGVRDDAAPLVGGRFRLGLNDRGVTTPPRWEGGTVTLGSKSQLLREDLRSKLSVLFAPLPAEPVGPGARWENVVTSTRMGGSLTESYRYHLVQATADGLELAVEVESHSSGPLTSNSLARGALRATLAGWRPARATFFRTAHIAVVDGATSGTIDQIGTLEVTAAGERAVPAPAICQELRRCCDAQHAATIRAYVTVGRQPPDGCR